MSIVKPFNGAECPVCALLVDPDSDEPRCPECQAVFLTVDGTTGRAWRGKSDPLPPVFAIDVRELHSPANVLGWSPERVKATLESDEVNTTPPEGHGEPP